VRLTVSRRHTLKHVVRRRLTVEENNQIPPIGLVAPNVTTDNDIGSFPKDVFVSVVCRSTTVAALLLHLIFGCSLHHAAACGSHEHDGCQHTCQAAGSPVVADSPSVHDSSSVPDDHVCDHHHGHQGSGEDESGLTSSSESQLVAPCCVCESQPCDGNHPGCHDEVVCSYVPSSDVAFNVDVPFVAFVLYDHDPMMSTVISLASRAKRERSAIDIQDSLSHCASLCTWII